MKKIIFYLERIFHIGVVGGCAFALLIATKLFLQGKFDWIEFLAMIFFVASCIFMSLFLLFAKGSMFHMNLSDKTFNIAAALMSLGFGLSGLLMAIIANTLWDFLVDLVGALFFGLGSIFMFFILLRRKTKATFMTTFRSCQEGKVQHPPLGIAISAVFVFFTSVYSIKSIFDDGKMLLFGILVLSGFGYKAYNFLEFLVGVIIAFGLYALKKWSFFLFLAQQLYSIISLLLAMNFITEETILEMGWEEFPNLLVTYRAILGVGAVFGIALVFWILCYKKYFGVKSPFFDPKISTPPRI